jgi:hypothetical protein
MIDIQPYLDKLDKLREYMFLRIDGKGKVFSINIDAIPIHHTPEEIIQLYYQTGFLLGTSIYNDSYQQPREITFDEWLETQAHTTLQIKQ